MKVKSPVISDDPGQDVTRRHLLEAAGEVFAEVGFRDATVREICQRAGANVAAINYHFGDKENLYAEVLRYAQGKALEKYPLLLGMAETAPPEQKLQAFVLSLLSRIFDKGPTSWHGRLMSREMIEPTAVLDSLIEERIRPMSDTIRKIVAEILRCPLTDECVGSCAISVVSQCVFYKHCRPVVVRIFPEHMPDDPAAIGRLAAHITRFSLAAMRDYSLKKA